MAKINCDVKLNDLIKLNKQLLMKYPDDYTLKMNLSYLEDIKANGF